MFGIRSSTVLASLTILICLNAVSRADLPYQRSGDWNEPGDMIPVDKKKGGEEVLGALLQSEESRPLEVDCFGRQCHHSEECCRGSVCVDVDGSKLGTCLPIYGQKEGEPCRENNDCEEGLRCRDNNLGSVAPRICQAPPKDIKKKQYNDECLSSNECDVRKGLCCQLQRRHRMQARKVCYYFADSRSCIGAVPSHLARPMGYNMNPFFKSRLG